MNTTSSPISVSLNDSIAEFVRVQVATCGFADPSEYVNRIIGDRQRELIRAELQSQVLAGVQSQPKHEATDEFWNNLDHEADQILANRKQS